MRRFVDRHPLWSVIIFAVVAVLLWMIFAVWPDWLTDAIGRKKVFLNALFNGITLGGLYFLVASGFTLIFGLMRNVNLAHGSLYLLGPGSTTMALKEELGLPQPTLLGVDAWQSGAQLAVDADEATLMRAASALGTYRHPRDTFCVDWNGVDDMDRAFRKESTDGRRDGDSVPD